MDPVSKVSDSTAEARIKWFDKAHEDQRRRYVELPLSTHGLLLQYDIRRAFSSGAWLSVIVLVQAAIEATIRDIGTQDYKTKANEIFAGRETLERIRELRNEILHPQAPGTPSRVWTVGGGDHAACHAALEADAKLAVLEMFRAVYEYRKT